MARDTAAILAAILLVFLFSSPALRAAPETVTDAGMAWGTVGGGGDRNPILGESTDLSRPGVIRDRFRETPRWIVSGDLDGKGPDELAILFADGTLEVHAVEGGRYRRLASWPRISPEAPPVIAPGGWSGETGPGVLCVDDRGRLSLYTLEKGQGRTLMSGLSTLTFPVLANLGKGGRPVLLAVGDDGRLRALDGDGPEVASRDATLLPDARIGFGDLNADGKTEIVVLTRPLEKAKTARFGDEVEAQGIAVFSWTGSDLRLDDEFRLDGKRFFEGLAPIMGDLDKSGKSHLIVPVTEETVGSSLWSFNLSGRSLRKAAEGPRTRDGKSFYQAVAVTPLGDQDRTLVLAVAGPEGQGVLEALRPDLAATRVGTMDGIVTHLTSSRSVDLALVGDIAGSGKRELLAPDKDGAAIRLFTFKGNAINSREIFPGGKPVSSNLCPGDFDGDGKLDVAFGTQDGTLVVLTGR